MRIALLTHIRHPIKAPFKGGMEAHSHGLAEALTRQGHDVGLFASGDSETSATLIPTLDKHYEATHPFHVHHGTELFIHYQQRVFERAMERIAAWGCDVVHNNSLHHYPIQYAHAHHVPMVSSMHVPPFAGLRDTMHTYQQPWLYYTATSTRQYQAWDMQHLPARVVHNGIDMHHWQSHGKEKGNGEAIWIGRITPNKGLVHAIEAAIEADIPLSIYGPVEDGAYYHEQIRPQLSSTICYHGHHHSNKIAHHLRQASVLLFTPMWDEPFGLVAVEALASGVPVACIDNGAVREVLGEYACYAPQGNTQALASAIHDAQHISRKGCRTYAMSRYSYDGMVQSYIASYHQAINSVPPVKAIA